MPQTSYTQIADILREQIISGQVPPGGQLPSEPALVQQYGVTRTTVRSAYNLLIQESLVIRRQKEGHYVRPVKPLTWHMTSRDQLHSAPGARPVDPWLRVVEEAGYVGTQTITIRIVGPGEPLPRGALGDLLTNGDGSVLTRAVCRDRVRMADGQPQELARSYYPVDLAERIPALMDEADIQPSIYHLLAELGHEQTGGQDRAYSRQPTQAEAEQLRITGVLSVMETVRTVRFTPYDRVMLVRHSVHVGGPDKEFIWEL